MQPLLERLRELDRKYCLAELSDQIIKGVPILFAGGDELKEMIVALDKRPADRAWYINRIEQLSDELAAAWKREAAMQYKRHGEVWYWQEDGDNHIESLTCPVMIPAETLRRLLASRQSGEDTQPEPEANPLDKVGDALKNLGKNPQFQQALTALLSAGIPAHWKSNKDQ